MKVKGRGAYNGVGGDYMVRNYPYYRQPPFYPYFGAPFIGGFLGSFLGNAFYRYPYFYPYPRRRYW